MVEDLEAKKAAAEAENESLVNQIAGMEGESNRVQVEKMNAEHELLDMQVGETKADDQTMEVGVTPTV